MAAGYKRLIHDRILNCRKGLVKNMKNKKRWLIISAALILTGLVVTGIGIVMGGVPGFSIGRGGQILTPAQYVMHELEKTPLESFENLDAVMYFGDVEVIPSDGYYLEYRVCTDEQGPSYEIKNNTLTFLPQKSQGRNSVSFFFNTGWNHSSNHTGSDYVRIYLPEDVYLKMLDIRCGNGDVKVSSIQADTVSIETDFGDTVISDMKAGEADVVCSNGRIEIDSVAYETLNVTDDFGNVSISDAQGNETAVQMSNGGLTLKNIESTVLRTELDFGNTAGSKLKIGELTHTGSNGNLELTELDVRSLDISNDFGNIDLALTEDEKEYGMDLSCDFGTVRLNGADRSDSLEKESAGVNKIQARCSNGNITVITK